MPTRLWGQKDGDGENSKDKNAIVAQSGQAQTTPSSPGPLTSSSGSPAFEIKASPAMSEDLCSAATTAVDGYYTVKCSLCHRHLSNLLYLRKDHWINEWMVW